MAAGTPAVATFTIPAPPSPPEVVVVPPALVKAAGAERLRQLHAELMRAIAAGHTLHVTVEPRDGRVMKIKVAPERSL